MADSPEKLSVGMLFDGWLRESEGVPAYIEDVGDYMDSQGHKVTYGVGGSDRCALNIVTLGKMANRSINGNRVESTVFIPSSRAKEVLEAMNPDVLHIQMPHNPFGTGRILRRAQPDVPAVGTFHVLPNSRAVEIAMGAFAVATRRANRRLHAIIGNSRATQEFLHRVFRLDSELIPNPVDVAKFQRGRKLEQYDDDKINIVFLGRLVERKGAQYLVEAVGALDDETKAKVRLLIAGKGELTPEIEVQIARLGLEHNTELLGYIGEEEKPHLLASADLAVFPAPAGESFGIVLTEAMAARAGVVIGGNNPGYSSVLHETPEALIDPRRILGFRDTLKWLIDHEEERDRLHAIQQEAVKACDIKKVGKAIEELYRDALAT